ncbi:hypothetical protein ACFWZ2_31750, partial [Streptomyces sp. NPDC059002]|uniref:hypothetical protein n=1 Tax=Streptomyces sp. NPDC059002 TaxID=3346690 RepID=UPI0036823BC9
SSVYVSPYPPMCMSLYADNRNAECGVPGVLCHRRLVRITGSHGAQFQQGVNIKFQSDRQCPHNIS